jgi:ubiquitin-protein ligase E3 C
MFQTFSGSSRKPRQVNLGGPKSNPFAKQSALQNAQQERENRQRERDRLATARLLQRRWRGYAARKQVRAAWRDDFDAQEEGGDAETSYPSQEVALIQLERLLQCANLRHNSPDIQRLHRYIMRLRSTLRNEDVICAGGPWPMAYLRLHKLVLTLIRTTSGVGPDLALNLLAVELVGRQIPELLARNARVIFSAMASVLEINKTHLQQEESLLASITNILVLPLSAVGSGVEEAYEAFAGDFLVSTSATSPPFYARWLDEVADKIDPALLANAVSTLVSSSDHHGFELMRVPARRYSLLGAFVYLHRRAHREHSAQAYTSHKEFVHSISSLLLSLASEISAYDLHADFNDSAGSDTLTSNVFAREQMLSLVNQESIRSLLNGATNSMVGSGSPRMNSEAKQLATYALTLLRFFPRRADEIRMWLYMGSTSGASTSTRLPAIKFFWQAARSSMVFKNISEDARSVIRLLKPQPAWDGEKLNGQHTEWVQDDWRVILIFLELYTFVLKLMDDEEFLSASSLTSTNSSSSSWARTNALPLEEVKDLTIFLKNLGFIMYFNAKDIVEESEAHTTDSTTLSSYFKVASAEREELSDWPRLPKTPETAMAGLSGISIDYVKGLVTGLLRMIHERDSRRKFLPKDHWLMTSLFEMDSFIPDVVAEEENRHSIEDGEDELEADFDDDEDGSSYIGTARDRSIRHQQRLEKQQRKASRRRYLQAVAPRSEILQNMPFFIPFTTRVEIFREFVRRDQLRRREGMIDAEMWRINMANSFANPNNLAKHTATVRRGHEFEDAFEQFYSLGEGLKEPIQITFMDKFGQQEAGIDGGGVTKEFLTSVTSEAFTPSNSLDLFKENEQRLLYPNPTAVEEQKELLRQVGIFPRTLEYNKKMSELMQRYEFLGRIVGKCLYEGILVDINFAPFFLLKWALTGGDGAAPRESGYRANLNDLRDIDQDLYKGLIQLKNYPGNVQEDLSLDFTIADTFVVDHVTGEEQVITKDLRPDGANVPVTNENRLVYISYVARHRLVTQPYAQTNAFLKGLSSIISPSWLSMFNQTELQTLISGTSSSISVADLRKNTAYGGVYVIGDDGLEHPTVQIFWSVMESLEDEDRRKVLKFVTSTPRAPLLGFGSLNPRFSIRDSSDDESRLPSTSTCVNLLKLPRYKKESTLREKLLYAVNSGAGFDLS